MCITAHRSESSIEALEEKLGKHVVLTGRPDKVRWHLRIEVDHVDPPVASVQGLRKKGNLVVLHPEESRDLAR